MRLLLCVCILLSALCACERPTSTDDLAAAQEAAEQRDWAHVARLLQRYLREENEPEKRWTAWNLLVSASQHMGEDAWVIDYLESMLQEYGDDGVHTADVLRRLGEGYEKTRQWDKASETWLHLLDVAELGADEAARLYRRMGVYHHQAHNFALAEDMFEMCVEHTASAALLSECRYLLADVYATQGNMDEAARYLDTVLTMPETEPDIRGRALLLKGDMYEQQGRRADAARAFAEALPLHPNPAVVQSRIDALKKRSRPLPPARP